MSFRDVLVQIDERPTTHVRALAAAQLAMRHGARLTGVFLKSDFLRLHGGSETIGYLSAEMFDTIMREQANAAARLGDIARAAFETAVRQTDVDADWRVIEADRPDALATLARQFDLTVLPTSVMACLGQSPFSAVQVAMATGGPILVLADDAHSPTLGENVLVAWKDTRESSRAVRDAMPILAAAEKVTILVLPDGDDAFPGDDLERHFRAHRCAFKLVVEHRHGLTTSELIRRQVTQLGADLLIMGLYGRPRVQEIVLGGVSKNMLHRPPAPLFVSH